MSVNDAIRAYNGVVNFINNNNFNIGQPKRKTYRAKEEYLNGILHKFGRDHNLKMEKNNSPRYKGTYSPCMSNCITIQNNWKLFVKWLKENYTVSTPV